MRQRSSQLSAVLLGLVLVGWGAFRVGNFIEDDALISLRYARRLLDGHGLTWTDGERVEGYSNLAWVLASAGLGAVGVDLIDALRLLAAGCTIVTFLALVAFLRRIGADWATSAYAALTLGATGSVSVWLMGGLEQPLVMACLAVAVWGLSVAQSAQTDADRGLRWAGTALAVLVLTRPDGPLFVALLTVALPLFLAERGTLRPLACGAAWVAGVPLAAYLVQLAFRLGYYGEWLPNTALIKASVTVDRARGGLEYVLRGLEASWLLTGAGGVGFVLGLLDARTRRWAVALFAAATGWLGYVVAIGGDHFPAWRHLLPSHVCAAALAGLGPLALQRLAPSLRHAGLAFLLLGAAAGRNYLSSQWALRDIGHTALWRWQWEGEAVGRTMGEAFARERPLYGVTAAGCLPYFSGLPALDLLGLNDRHIARQPADPRLPLGHDHGDGRYVLERAPDLITFGMPRGDGPHYKSGDEMARDPRFGRDYRRISFQALEPLLMMNDSYVKLDGRLGIRREGGQVRVPAYLFSGAVGLPLPEGGMGARVADRVTLPLTLAAGHWRLRVEPANPRVSARFSATGPTRPGPDGALVLTEEGSVELELDARDFTTVVGSVIVEAASERPPEAPPPTPSTESTPFPMAPAFGVWEVTGEAFGESSVTSNRPGQGALTGFSGAVLNSFGASEPGRTGDGWRGQARSPRFNATPGAFLELRIGGGRAEGFDSQVGVRLVELLPGGARRTRYAFTGRRDEALELTRLDLGWLAGRTLSLEAFDEATGGWGHVLLSDVVLHLPR